MTRPDKNHGFEGRELIDRHLAGVLTPVEVEKLEQKIRTSPAWAQHYREAEELARVLRDGLGGGATAPAAVKAAIRQRLDASGPGTPVRRTWMLRAGALAAVVLLAVGTIVLWPRDRLLTPGFPDEPLALNDLARLSTVAFEADTELVDGRIRVRPRKVLYGEVAGRAIVVPTALRAGDQVVFYGRYDEKGMIHAVQGMRGVVHLRGVQRWEGQDRDPDATRAMAHRATDQRTLKQTMADLESFLASDASLEDSRAGLMFTADVAARHLGTFDFESILKPLVALVLNGDKDPRARHAAAEGLARSNRRRACEVLLDAMTNPQLAMVQAESEDGLVLLSCLDLVRRGGDERFAPTLRRVGEVLKAPALRRAAQAALDAVQDESLRSGPGVSAPKPMRFDVDGRTCVFMPGVGGECKALLVIFRGVARISAFRPVFQRAIARGLGVLVLPPDVDFDASVAACTQATSPCTAPLRFFAHGSAVAQARTVGTAAAPERSLVMQAAGADTDGDRDVMQFVATAADRLDALLAE